jgi:hypothetical protein
MNRPSRRMRWCCCSLFVLTLVPAALLVLVMIPPPRPRPLSAAKRAEVEKRVEVVKQQVKSLAEDAKQGRPRDFELVVEEAELNELLLTDPDVRRMLQQVQVSEPYVVVEDGRIRLTVTRDVGGVDVASTVTVHPRIGPDGRVAVSVESAQLGRLKMPDAITQRFADRLARDIARNVNEGRVRLRTVRVETGRIVVAGATR